MRRPKRSQKGSSVSCHVKSHDHAGGNAPSFLATDPACFATIRDMIIPLQVAEFLQDQQGLALCDPCIQKRLSITLSQARTATARLGRRGGFDRRVEVCAGCGQLRKVTRIRREAWMDSTAVLPSSEGERIRNKPLNEG